MSFRVTARTILQLGAELISSDAIAFYELIKNAFDAGSRRVEINIIVRIPHDVVMVVRDVLAELGDNLSGAKVLVNESLLTAREIIKSEVDHSAQDSEELKRRIDGADSIKALEDVLDEANYIEILDTGEGMSLDDLINVYLTIGTRSRLEQREQQQRRKTSANDGASNKGERPILGEKGLGRLSTMRLGRKLRVETSKTDEARWNVLEVDWNLFSHASDKLIEEIKVAPRHGAKKEDRGVSGTRIRLTGLESGWSLEKLEKIARDEFSRLTDPFVPRSRYPITLRFNGTVVPIISLDKLLFEHAHAVVNAELRFDSISKPHLVGSVDYKYRDRKKTFELQETDIVSITKSTPLIISRLGPFTMQLYWFNRRLLTAAAGVPDHQQVKKLVERWAGGLMLYRDGFRVNPYGSPEDDWLNLDRSALASTGYKVNRRQVIGKVDISSRNNTHLVDQTNREGLRENEEKQSLVRMLQHVLMAEFRVFLNTVDTELRARDVLSFDDVEERVIAQDKLIEKSLQTLVKNYPQIAKQSGVINAIQDASGQIRALMKEATQLADEYEKGRTQLVHLAGLGLMVEIIGHELGRATAHTLSTLNSSKRSDLPPDVALLFDTLKEQLKTLEKRLRVLDPLSTSGRQVKESFDLVAWVDSILKSHEAQFDRYGIKYRLLTKPSGSDDKLTVKAVKGMIVQILENLISNSVYWLNQRKRLEPSFKPQISVVIDTQAKDIRVTDNGPGISPARRDEIFQPFVTTKPPGEGKGLGLYISREIAIYNGASLYLSDEQAVHPQALNTFVFALESKNK